MAQEPMRTRRSPGRVPGFGALEGVSPDAQLPPVEPAAVARVDVGQGGVKQLTLRLPVALHRRYRRLVRDLEDEGVDSSMTELIHALLHEGPASTSDARALVRRWRQTSAPEV